MTPNQNALRAANRNLSDIEKRAAEAIANDNPDPEAIKTLAAEKAAAIEYRDSLASLVETDGKETTVTGLRPTDSGPDSAGREFRAALDRYSVLRPFQAAGGKKLAGAEAEVNSERGFEDNQIAIEAFESGRPVEERAITPAPGTVGVNLAPIQPFVFSESIAPMMNLHMPMVPSGTYAVPVITTSLTAATRAKGTAATAGAGATTVASMTPHQVSAGLELNMTDILAAGTDLEGPFRSHMMAKLSEVVDSELINGPGTTHRLSGFFEALDDPSADGTTLTFDHGLSKLAALVDGTWAYDTDHVAMIVGVETFRLACTLFRDKEIDEDTTNEARAAVSLGDQNLRDYFKMHSAGFSTNSRMPAVASTKQQGLVCRKGKTGLRTATCAHWGSITIDDQFTGSAKAEKAVWAHVFLSDVTIQQEGAYSQIEFKVS